MNELHLPWLELSVLLPLLGALWVSLERDPDRSRRRALVVAGATLCAAVAAWLDFATLHTFVAHDHWDITASVLHHEALVLDELSAPLLPLAALLAMLMILATLRTKVRRFSFARTLVSESILLAMFACRSPWGVIALLTAANVPVWIELRKRGQTPRVFALHMGLSVALLIAGQLWIDLTPAGAATPVVAVTLLAAAALIRNGVIPVQCWISDLFERASFGTALLFVAPMTGAYAVMRLVLPFAPGWLLNWIALFSIVTSVYAAGMALVQQDARRFFVYVFLSQSSLVLVGLESANPVGLTGALCVWLSTGLALGGFGLTLRSIEARTGRLSLAEYHGFYDRAPLLAAFFLLTGLASIGFPATIGFIGTELLIESAVHESSLAAAIVVAASALNGLAVLHAYFRVFSGTVRFGSVDLSARWSERIAILALTALIIGGGLYPQPGVSSRHHAAIKLLSLRPPEPEIHGAAAHHEKASPNFPAPPDHSPTHTFVNRTPVASR
ncbi:MAG: oxidoreductase [Planctomycetaceae bacterium]|nr:oxidoreductase [Planctomycetaceae bacterium]